MNILYRFRRRKRTNERKSEIRNFCNICLFRYSLLSKKKKKTTNTKIIGRGGRLIFDPSDGCLFFRLRSEISINIYKMPEKCLIQYKLRLHIHIKKEYPS